MMLSSWAASITNYKKPVSMSKLNRKDVILSATEFTGLVEDAEHSKGHPWI
jgi:hypothetical protein